jgi:Holliday junction resolvase RusA-like endonuclease
MKLTITGEIPSLKNSKQIFTNRATGRPFITSSNNSKVWQAEAKRQLVEQFEGLKVVDYPVGIAIEFYYGSKRRKDLDNGANGVMDALVHAGILEDDDVAHVDNLTLSFGGYDKENPRCIVYIDD